MASSNQATGTQNAGKKQYSGDRGNRHVYRTDLYFTAVVNIRLPFANGGLIHLSNVPLFLPLSSSRQENRRAQPGAFGMGLFDLFSGWTAWAPFTFVIVGLMGILPLARSLREEKGFGWKIVAILVACDQNRRLLHRRGIIYGNWITPASSIPGNLLRVGVAAVVVLELISGQLRNWQKGWAYVTK